MRATVCWILIVLATTGAQAQENLHGWEARRLRTSDAAKAGGYPSWQIRATPGEGGAVSFVIDEAKGSARGCVYLGRRVKVDADCPPTLSFSYTSFCALAHRSGNIGMAIFDTETWNRLGKSADTVLCQGARELRPRWAYPLHGMTGPDVLEPIEVDGKATAVLQQVSRTYAGQEVVLAVTWMAAHTCVERASFRDLQVVLGKPENAMQSLLDRLDLDAPELVAVKECRTKGDLPGGVDALVAHFRKRWPGVPQPTAISRGSLEECDQALENRFRSIGSGTFYKLGEDFEWSRNAIDDQEWLLHFQWHHWLKALVEAGQIRQDPRYTRKAIELIRDWIPKNYPGAKWSWRTLEVSLRAMNWPQVYRYLLHSPDFAREDHVAFLNTLAEHADYLLPVERFHSGHNFGATESKAMLTMGMTFPEFANAKTWRETAWQRFEGEITDQVLPDGAQKELTTGYHNGVLTTFLTVARMVEGTDMAPSKLYWERLEKMHDYTLFLTKPDGAQPDLGDSWRGHQGKILVRGAGVFDRPDMMFVGSDGEKGTRPEYLDTQLPETGYFVMRTSWTDDPDGLYLCFDAARHWGGWHQHYDALGVILYAHGRTLTPDAGPFAYGNPLRAKFRSTAFHSTITVDESDQDTSPCRVHAVRSLPGFSFADAEHSGYEGVTHRRQILFARPDQDAAGYFLIVDRVTGEGDHTLDAHFHLPPGPVKEEGRSIRTEFREGGNVLIQGLGEGELSLETSWTMTGYGKKTDRPDVRFRRRGSLPAVFVTLLTPFRGAEAPKVQARLLASDPVTVEVRRDGRRDLLFASPAVQAFSLDGVSGSGQAGLVRLAEDGKVALQAVVGEE